MADKKKFKQAELVDQIAESHDLTKAAAKRIIDEILDTVTAVLVEKGEVSFPGFGKFETADRAARKGRNPQTGEEIQIAASTVPKFRAGKKLKDVIAGR